ncbi:BTAD domain-containing putative transcriptional regulator [Micromonospora tulbaghiae]|uniref:DNA-binding transcriptional activator of the SARP family n=1 Tax=Micromonospora tulbaghiae TaxID=479978 RepID=A0ABY0KHQ7_9ACTN|nr:BTAD domain-containing putative transcriptional regulator [Micromonospora tulbaghiae]MDX5459187.1 AAA family ATPase [Micromonospora tulbaghiae]SCE74075.1 DNA-binding transcriptional activator of the SARP family [Micromonospora tulbaghiae]
MRRLRVTVLGPVRAWNGEVEIDLGPARRRALFAMLAANANRPVTRDELIRALWGESAPSAAAGNIYTYVSGLRRSLGPAGGLLRSGRTGYTLRLEPGALDADRFEALCEAAVAPAAAGRPGQAVALLDEALALWQGEAYANVTGLFADLDRHRLTELRIAAAERRARLVLSGGGDDALIADLTALVRDHPLHEPFHELLMRALHRAGRGTEALDVFHAARRVLVGELGVEPGPALRELQSRILAEPAPPAPAVPVTPAAVAAPAVPRRGRLVGRDRELSLLRGLLGAVGEGRSAIVWIEGEPGIGKSALLDAALHEARALGHRVARGSAEELSSRIPLHVMRRALRLEDGPHDDPATAADRVLDHVRRLTAEGPLVLAVDHLQWADEASLLAWERLAALTRWLPLLLVATARPEPGRRDLARLRRGVSTRDGHLIRLTPLPPSDIEQIFGRTVGVPPGATLRSLAPLAAGNPLYARELVTGLVAEDGVRVVDGLAEVDARADEMPRSLLDTVRASLDHLSPGAREALRYAALLGDAFAVAEVAAVTGRTPFDLMADLEEAVAADVLVDAGSELAFRQPVLRRALAGSIPAALRPTLHRHAAQALADNGGSVARVADHLLAGPPEVDEWLVGWLVTHGAELSRQAPQPARELLRRALAGHRLPQAWRATLAALLDSLDR